jgi:hypothetical protein
MRHRQTIFTFWEPKGNMTPYLALCFKTWQKHLPDYEIIILDYSNIGRYLPEETLDFAVLKQLPLAMQKDAVMVAVLQEHGGIFLDADTLVTGDVIPFLLLLEQTETVMIDTYCNFLAARPGAHLLQLWQQIIQEKLIDLKHERMKPHQLQWDYLANSALYEAMDRLITRRSVFYRMQQMVDGHVALAYRTLTRDGQWLPRGIHMWINRIGNALTNRKRALYFRFALRRFLVTLNRLDVGYIPEARYLTSIRIQPSDKYTKFWFNEQIDLTNAFMPNQTLIGLHNSWTPDWYKDLSEQEVLENQALLSRTLKHLS